MRIRKVEVVTFAVFLALCFCGVAYAAEDSVPADVNWGALVVAVLSLAGVFERLRDWAKRYGTYLQIIHSVIENLSESSEPDVVRAMLRLKGQLEQRTYICGGQRVRDLAMKYSARAEELNGRGRDGTSQESLRLNGRRMVVRSLLRCVPVIGRFF